MLAVETCKYMIQLTHTQRQAYMTQLVNYMGEIGMQLKSPSPVYRRARDSKDVEVDVCFFEKAS